jgi:hypothetical protein
MQGFYEIKAMPEWVGATLNQHAKLDEGFCSYGAIVCAVQHGGGAAGFADTVGASKPTERGLCEGREDSEEYMDCQ